MAVITVNDPNTFTILSPAQAMPAIAAHVMRLQGWDDDNDEAHALVSAALGLFAGHLAGLLVASMNAHGATTTIAQLLPQLQRAAEAATRRHLPMEISHVPATPSQRQANPEDAA